jgi:predicted acyltransferase
MMNAAASGDAAYNRNAVAGGAHTTSTRAEQARAPTVIQNIAFCYFFAALAFA